jgi:lipopolysaccharide export system permease protein
MKKLIFQKLNQDILSFFATSIILMGLIVWTLQAVNYFDLVAEDGHGLKIYFYFTILNFPKIIHRILPFIFFISLFYTLIMYEFRHELNVFWLNGINKIYLTNKIIFLAIVMMFFQIFLGSYVSPTAQFKARDLLKNSNIDFFTSLIKEGKFINVVKDLTIFIEKKNEDGSYTDIFIDDSTKENSKMIYAKNGILIDNKKQKIFKLLNGKVINNEKSKINIFEFDQIDFNLKTFDTNTIIVPKIQEISSLGLLGCFFKNIKSEKFDSFNCDKTLPEVKQELLKRLYKPIYIPIIAILTCFLIITSSNKINYKKIRNLVFITTFIILVISEASLRYSVSTEFLFYSYLVFPWLIFISSYLIFFKMIKNV